jgi:hypothetical protein
MSYNKQIKQFNHHPTWSWNRIQHKFAQSKLALVLFETQTWTHDKDTNIRQHYFGQPNTGHMQFHSMWLARDVFGKREEWPCVDIFFLRVCIWFILVKGIYLFPLGPAGIRCPKGYFTMPFEHHVFSSIWSCS